MNATNLQTAARQTRHALALYARDFALPTLCILAPFALMAVVALFCCFPAETISYAAFAVCTFGPFALIRSTFNGRTTIDTSEPTDAGIMVDGGNDLAWNPTQGEYDSILLAANVGIKGGSAGYEVGTLMVESCREVVGSFDGEVFAPAVVIVDDWSDEHAEPETASCRSLRAIITPALDSADDDVRQSEEVCMVCACGPVERIEAPSVPANSAMQWVESDGMYVAAPITPAPTVVTAPVEAPAIYRDEEWTGERTDEDADSKFSVDASGQVSIADVGPMFVLNETPRPKYRAATMADVDAGTQLFTHNAARRRYSSYKG